jgi:hypothetical protein
MRITNLSQIKPVPPDSPASLGAEAFAPSIPDRSEFTQLIQDLFCINSAVAVIGSGALATRACGILATELSSLGRYVVIVSVETLLDRNPIPHPDTTGFGTRRNRRVWLWPPLPGQGTEIFKSQGPFLPESWLDSLCRNFDSVLLDCPELETSPECAAIAVMAGSAVLAVEAARTPKHQILRYQRMLQSTGIRLAGSILISG